MDSLRAAIGLTPLAAYLFVVGLINLSRQPQIRSGTRDFAALGVALSGLVMVGPVELLMPTLLVANYGPLAWGLAVAIYGSGWALLAFSSAPRLVVYNLDADRFRRLVSDAAARLDPEAHWAGDSVILPGKGIQARIETFSILRNMSLISNGPRQDFAAWAVLEKLLRASMAGIEVQRNPRGVMMLALSLVIAAALVFKWAGDPLFAQKFADMIGL